MGTRIRENPERLFELFVEVARPDADTEPFILQCFPEDYSDQDVLKNISKFAFPCQTESNMVDHFTFVLTDIESMYRFGFCRHATGAQTCLCFISFLPWYEVFYSLLNYSAELLNQTGGSVDTLLSAAYIEPIPPPGIPVTVVAGQDMFSFTGPDPSKLPSIPNSRNVTEYYNAIDTDNMMKIFASMLNERRILVTSRKLSRLTACVHAAASLLYPMHWQHLYIPVMPQHLIDYCSAPMPYIIGIHSSLYVKLRASDLGDVVVIDADKNTFTSEFDDLANMPSDVISSLKKSLRFQHSDPKKSSQSLTGDALPAAFLKALVKLIGGYRDALRFRHGEPITFDPVAFVQTRPPHMQQFLETVLHLQIFQQFIHDRLDMLNCGQGFNDLFESEATLLGDKLNAQTRYRDWNVNMKKQGKRFQKGGKVVWSRLQKSAGPMMDTAMKNMRSQGHKAYKGIRSHIKNLAKVDEPEHTHGTNRSGTEGSIQRVRTNTPNRQAYSMVNHSTLPRSSSSGDKPIAATRKSSQDRTSKTYKLLTVEEKSIDDTSFDYNRVSINLVNDPDIQRAMKKSISLEDVPSQLRESTDSLDSSSSGSDDQMEVPVFEPSVQYGKLIDEPTPQPSPKPRTPRGSPKSKDSPRKVEIYESTSSKTYTKPPEIMSRSCNIPHDSAFTELLNQNMTSSMTQNRPLFAPPRRQKPPIFYTKATSNVVDTEETDSMDTVPIPPPRSRNKSSQNDIKPDTEDEAPSLIHLDSTDSDDGVSFDPLDDRPKNKRQLSLKRSQACRVTSTSLEPTTVGSVSANKSDNLADLFDPLRSKTNSSDNTTSVQWDTKPIVSNTSTANSQALSIPLSSKFDAKTDANKNKHSSSTLAEFGNVSISTLQQKLLNNQYSTSNGRMVTDSTIQIQNTQRLIQNYDGLSTLSRPVTSGSVANPLYPYVLPAKPVNPFIGMESTNNPFLPSKQSSQPIYSVPFQHSQPQILQSQHSQQHSLQSQHSQPHSLQSQHSIQSQNSQTSQNSLQSQISLQPHISLQSQLSNQSQTSLRSQLSSISPPIQTKTTPPQISVPVLKPQKSITRSSDPFDDLLTIDTKNSKIEDCSKKWETFD